MHSPQKKEANQAMMLEGFSQKKSYMIRTRIFHIMYMLIICWKGHVWGYNNLILSLLYAPPHPSSPTPPLLPLEERVFFSKP